MQQNKQRKSAPSNLQSRVLDAIKTVANEHCLRNYGTSYTSGIPFRLNLPTNEMWIVPIIFTSPGYGKVGDVGVLGLDAATKAVVAATPQNEVRAAGRRLAQEKRHELDAAFHRARKA